jgi:DnaJ-class molecular chaperone
MALKNYYIILGISPNTSAEDIRFTFRQLAKKFHPDKAGGEKTAFFQDITEAYEVLSDPKKRKLYNQKLTEENKRQKSIPIHRAPDPQENRTNHFRSNVSSKISVQSRLWRGPRENIHPKQSFQRRFNHEFGPDLLEMDAYLTPEEAFSGVAFNLRLSIPAQCQWCEGTGRDFIFNCSQCYGSGVETIQRPIVIDLPSRLKHGERINATVFLSEENYLHLFIQVYII